MGITAGSILAVGVLLHRDDFILADTAICAPRAGPVVQDALPIRMLLTDVSPSQKMAPIVSPPVVSTDVETIQATRVSLNENISTHDNQEKLAVISVDDFRKMSDNGRLVVVFRGIVYDVTNFTGHPGGYGRLQMASGGDLEVFWRVYTQHNRGHIEGLLINYQIGTVSPADAVLIRESTHFDNPYLQDPTPYPDLLTNTRYPYNAEGRLRDLGESWITPIGLCDVMHLRSTLHITLL